MTPPTLKNYKQNIVVFVGQNGRCSTDSEVGEDSVVQHQETRRAQPGRAPCAQQAAVHCGRSARGRSWASARVVPRGAVLTKHPDRPVQQGDTAQVSASCRGASVRRRGTCFTPRGERTRMGTVSHVDADSLRAGYRGQQWVVREGGEEAGSGKLRNTFSTSRKIYF